MTAQDVDRCLRDIATGAIAQSQESTPLIPDWTLEEEIDPTFEATDDSNNIRSNSNPEEPITPTNVKPCLSHNPPLWATSRQEICESTDYFRSYQGGVYFSKEVVKGYLLSAFSASHDIFHHGGKLIISHGGGKAESTLGSRCGEKRHMSADDQQATDHSVHALLNTYESKRPLILLADDKYSLFPFDLAASGFTYVVLGLYWISHVWAERQSADNSRGHVIRYKFAFQWCEEQGFPWWIPPDRLADIAIAPSLAPEPNNDRVPEGQELPPATNQTCAQCARKSSVVYSCGWMCLRPRCSAFWCIATGERPPTQLQYDEEFLRLLPANFKNLPALRPIIPHSPDEITTSYLFTKGWHCPKCGRLSSRYKWEQWECSSCGYHLEVKGRVRQPNEFWHQRPNATFLHSHIGKNSGIIQCLPKPFNYGKGFTNCLTFILPRQRGSIHLILGSPMANTTANDIFKEYQEEAASGQLKLRRYPLRTVMRGPLLTNYFSQNTGEPYQYIGGTGNTIPFKMAPECVNQAIALIKERAQLALGRDIGFNEILSAAYMERQKMSFHSDSEKGLGPTVASLSLGSTAFMHFRAYDTATKGQPLHDLTLILRHGDVLIMEGEGVQKHYEHTVIPMNFRIAATARCIGSV
ncbi:2OG-Fe(II) oxygenase superfamily-domain-containing protein [Hygrophoropsis aurantiaca]|uniref:2OG-Fe(II) oxygenase superfamily-domain-containing protein n=1 Tax=Hygrophoropsis aurantiaca TaxID=72124 RepID=A0ACB8AT42_9AGAM|nr:2OG-Fe(II) oxygenase superfamily-domain-containing protein [Hygrophoropsis aurantiaca]